MKYTHVIWTRLGHPLPSDPQGDWASLADIYSSFPHEYHLVEKSQLYENYRKTKVGMQTFNEEETIYIEKGINQLVCDDRVASIVNPIKVVCFSQGVELLIQGSFKDAKQGLSRLKSRISTLVDFQFEQRSALNWSKGFWAAEFNESSALFKAVFYYKIPPNKDINK